MLDQQHQRLGVVVVEAHSLSDVVHQGHAHHGVVAGVALANVVQQRAEQQQVGPLDTIAEIGGACDCFEQVAIDSEAVIRVALRTAPIGFPFGQQTAPQIGDIERLDNRYGIVAAGE